MAVFALTGANAHVNSPDEVANVQAVESSTTYRATYSKDNLNVYDKTFPIIATVNGNSVDFNKNISFSFYTGNVNITGAALNETDITTGITGTVVIERIFCVVLYREQILSHSE